MSNSPLVTYKRISPHKTVNRKYPITVITPHIIVGQWTAKQGCDYFATTDRAVSANYVVGKDGSIGLSVDEKDRAYTTGGYDSNGNVIYVNGISGSENDHMAVTIEIASDTKPPYKITEAAYDALIELMADICRRNKIKELKWHGDKSLIGKTNEQNITVHRWFATKSCPGEYVYSHLGDIAKKVNERLASLKDSPIIENTESNNDEDQTYESINVGDIMNFVGTKQYAYAQANSGNTAKSSRIKVTQKYKKDSKHPIHVRSVDDKGQFISGVYGWVNVDDLKSIAPESYKVRVTVSALNYRSGPSTSHKVVGIIRDKGVYTIIQEKDGWGQLKSKAGWISLKYTKKV